MRHASLFSGIGAPELAAYWLGWENAFHCEINPYCRQVIEYWFNSSLGYEDITKTDFKRWRGQIDVLSGGFPCQPFSVAGRRKGAEDHRYLWPEFKRVIREVKPRWVIGENVGGITSMVQPGKEVDLEKQTSTCQEINKETLLEQEFVIETICRDLECEGYSIQPVLIPACGVGAPHRRDRVWFIAHNNSIGLQNEGAKQFSAGDSGICEDESSSDSYCGSALRDSRLGESTGEKKWISERDQVQFSDESDNIWTSTYSAGSRQFNWSSDWEERQVCSDQERMSQENQSEWERRESRTGTGVSFSEYSYSFGLEGGNYPGEGEVPICGVAERNPCKIRDWKDFPTEPPICRGDDGLSELLDLDSVFKGIGYTRGSVFNRWRAEAVKAYGNAMVPQVIYQIYKHIDYIENRLMK